MSWNRGRSPQKRGRKWTGPAKKQKNFLKENKRFTGILLLICLCSLLGVHLFMWQLHDKTCAVSCSDPSVGCWSPIGYAALFGPCHGFNVRLNETQAIGFNT